MNHVVEAVGATVPALPFSPPALMPGGPSGPDGRIEVPLDQVSFMHAQTSSQLRRIAHLREAIALPPSVRDAPAFTKLEKKETSWAS